MRLLDNIEKKLGYKKIPSLSIGDVVSVVYETRGGSWKTRKFTGICIQKSCKGFNERYTLRNVVSGFPVEFSFYRYWNLIVKLEIVAIHKFDKVRKGSLVYLRNKKLNLSKVR